MGIFFVSPRPVLSAITAEITDSLKSDTTALTEVQLVGEAAKRTVQLSKTVSPEFRPWRFAGAVVIAAALLITAIWAQQHNLNDISKTLMSSFTAFSSLVVGLLGGEAQKSVST